MNPSTRTPLSPQPIDPQAKYTHFIEHDARIWHTLLLKTPPENATVLYDLHVGELPTFANNFPANYRRMIEQTARKRIDAILFFPNETLIIEVSPYAGLDAIGKTLSYTVLFTREHPSYPKPTPTIVTDRSQPDMHNLCTHFNVLLIETDLLPEMD